MARNDFTAIIPVRLESTRLPNKPLADIGGIPMFVRTLKQAAVATDNVVAAVAEPQLAQAAQAAGFKAVITGTHDSGSSRAAAAARSLQLPADAVIVNVQGDEPFIEPALISAVAEEIISTKCSCVTVCRPLSDAQEYQNPAVVKVVMDKNNNAAYFSRAPVPFMRGDGVPATARVHLGIYAYTNRELQRFTALPPAPTEQTEKLEQLRILWHGGHIRLLEYPSRSFGIDTPADLERARRMVANRP